MESFKFCNKKTLKVKSDKILNFINSKLSNFNIDKNEKNYKFLDNISINYLKINEHYVTYTTFGHKYFLYLTKYNNKNSCFFINKKNNLIIYCRFRFKDELFNNTIFDGELFKDNNNIWHFSISDLLIHKNNILNKLKLSQKLEIMNDIFKNNYIEDSNFNLCKLNIKEYFNYDKLADLYHDFIPNLNFKCSGLLFKSKISNEKALLYIFIENRTKKKISDIKINDDNITDNKLDKEKIINDGTKRSFLIKKMDLPDIYEVFCSKNRELFKIGIASVTNLEHSKFLNNIFINTKDNYMHCEYISKFNKWKPYKISESIDDYKLIFNSNN